MSRGAYTRLVFRRPVTVMASLYKRGSRYWVSHYVNDRRINQSLHTDNLKIVREKKRTLEHELAIGDLQQR